MKATALCLAALLLLLVPLAALRAGEDGPIVGAIRWDGWYGDGTVTKAVEASLGQPKYHFRLPWFAQLQSDGSVRINGDSQAIMEQELAYAAAARLNYWAIVDYWDEAPGMSIALNRYLAAKDKRGIRYCLVEEGHRLDKIGRVGWKRLVEHFQKPDYQTVLDGRPLLFVFEQPKQLGKPEWDDLRRQTLAAGLKTPYLVLMGYRPEQDAQGVTAIGFDAVSAYARGGSYSMTQPTYAEQCGLIRHDRWEKWQALRVPSITFASAGWDTRPRNERPPFWLKNEIKAEPDPTPLAQQKPLIDAVTATPDELAAHVCEAVQWADTHRDLNPANAVIIYAWNEHDEGGWLQPTRGADGKPDDSRIHALGKALRALQTPTAISKPGASAANKEQAEQLFVRHIIPLFHAKCLSCHGKDESQIKGGLDMRTLASILKGGESEQPALVVGKPEQSPLYLAVTRKHDDWQPMPPKEADKLSAEQMTWIKEWIADGALWPDDARVKDIAKANFEKWSAEDGITVKTSGGLSPEWTDRKYKSEGLWAYQPVKKPTPPMSDGNPIDTLITTRLPAGLPSAPLADRVTLIRRATFDLIGLPPKPEEVEAFLKDSRSDADAFAKVVDRLLGSPHYGERMAQHWLDVTRYADTSGFANDYERGNAWRYRDYVVRFFNADKRYDQFVREQIAGDELDANNPEMLIATGFLRMGPWELTGMEVAKVARQRFLDDVTNGVGETFLAHSLQCARCHDHKFDPIPTRDYYSLQAVFATTQLVERAAPFLPSENRAGFEEKKYLEMQRAEHLAVLARLDDQMLAAAQQWLREKRVDPAKWNAAVEKAAGAKPQESNPNSPRREFKDVFNAARNTLRKDGVPEDQFPPKLVGFSPEDFGNERVARKGLERLKWELERYEPFALAVYNGRTPQVTSISSPIRMPANRMTDGELEQTCVLTGGDPFGSGQMVKPGVLSVLAAAQKTPIADDIEGRRLAFADWVASPDNPLTTRAIVNRIWLWHFDQPIAGNPNNFGSTGRKPTHPELLDWLAATFVEEGWSFKAMHRLIMNSETYRRDTRHPDRKTLADKDPSGTSYAVFKPRRLTAEELRDAMLSATGELNAVLGGIPNRPEINLEAALQPRQVMGTFAAAWTPNPLPHQRHRRSLYSLKVRGLPDPLQEVFNAPTPDFSCERRQASTVTPQVFSLFNGQTSHARALALANRAMKETQTDEQAIARCFALAFSRQPNKDELQTCLTHWRDIEALLSDNKTVASKPPLEVRRDAVEENTGEKFSFNEKLHAYADFVPDLQPSDVPAHTRALADVCLALFNSNEFVYVD